MDMPFAGAALVIELWLLLLIANGAPVVAKRILGSKLAYPLDGGCNFFDGQPLFGAAKTIRGIVASILATSIVALLLGYPLQTGVLFATAALSGDLVSSFIKRRMRLPPSSKAPGLDQLPESILPLLLCWQALGLDIATSAAVILLFVAAEAVLSKLLFRLKIRDRPY